jgi:tRNA (guanine37-N1)-methyltransferase
MVRAVLSESIIGRGEKRGCISINYYQLRDYSQCKHKNVDDTLYGGGKGMLLTAAPIYNCWSKIKENISGGVKTVYMSPKGALLTQEKAEQLAGVPQDLIIICGHYEGVDERVLEEVNAEEISIGDFILTGGELPCAILVDCVARLADGVLAYPECHEKESISSGLLEYPQYTKPFDFMGREVPEVLVSGHHANIEKWRREQSLKLTAERRPDLLEKNIDSLDECDLKFLRENKLFGVING